MMYDLTSLIADIVDVADHAAERCAESPAWRRAVDKAFDELLDMEQVEWLPDDTYVFASKRRADVRYEATPRACNCPAARHGRVCWHRAAARIIRLAQARHARQALVETR